jgi:hypothetical protein
MTAYSTILCLEIAQDFAKLTAQSVQALQHALDVMRLGRSMELLVNVWLLTI